MSRLARGLARLAWRGGLGRRAQERAEMERRRRAGWRWPLDEPLLRRLERATVFSRQAAAGGLGGEHRSRARAASSDFVDYRPYLPGDDFRRVDWNAYSRLDQLFVKLTEGQERLSLHLLLDCSASMSFGYPNKHDYARQLAAAIGYVALVRYDRVELIGLAGSGARTRPLQGKRRFGDLLAGLDALETSGTLSEAELAAFRPGGSPGHAIIISDMLHPAGYQHALEALERVGLEQSIFQVLSPQELEPEPGGDVELQDVESGERLEVGLSPRATAIYQSRLAEWCDAVERYCARRGLGYLRVGTDEPLEHVALVAMRRARMLV